MPRVLALVLSVLVLASPAFGAEFKPIILDPSYEHDKFVTRVQGVADYTQGNYLRRFRAYITLFDGEDDDNGDGKPDFLGVPHFVAYEIKRYQGNLPAGPDRPSQWITDKDLAARGIAPTDATYRYSTAFLQAHSNWYVRGHLAMKQHAWRLGANADWNTHTVLNAVPQRQDFNAGIWLDLENKTAAWADKFGRVWIIAGPIFEPQRNTPRAWLGERTKGEMLIGIPDKLFKIVVRQSDDTNRPHVLAFIYPQEVPRISGAAYDHRPYMTSVDVIQEKTGLDFLTVLPDDAEKEIEKQVTKALWPVN